VEEEMIMFSIMIGEEKIDQMPMVILPTESL
jgi:hypothetical protein